MCPRLQRAAEVKGIDCKFRGHNANGVNVLDSVSFITIYNAVLLRELKKRKLNDLCRNPLKVSAAAYGNVKRVYTTGKFGYGPVKELVRT